MRELVFKVHLDEDGGYWARPEVEAIYAQGDSWDELCTNALGGVEAFYALTPETKPGKIKLLLHVEREQELLVA